MFLLPGGYVQVDTLDPCVFYLLPIPVAVVGANCLGLGPHILRHLLHHGHQLLLVVALLRYLRRHDHLRFPIHRDLRVVALHESALVPPSGMIRLSGSVKLRCAFGSGTACSGSATCGSRPLTFLPVRASCSWRCLIWASAAACFSSAFCLASASNSAFAARIFASRLSRRANSAGNSSPACSFPYFSSSAASTASARCSSASTSACSFFSASLIRS